MMTESTRLTCEKLRFSISSKIMWKRRTELCFFSGRNDAFSYQQTSIFLRSKTYTLCMFSFILSVFYVNLMRVSQQKRVEASSSHATYCWTKQYLAYISDARWKHFFEYFSSRDDLDKLYASQEKTLTEWESWWNTSTSRRTSNAPDQRHFL